MLVLLAGPLYGPGLLDFRDTAVAEGMTERLIQVLQADPPPAAAAAFREVALPVDHNLAVMSAGRSREYLVGARIRVVSPENKFAT